MFLEAYKPQKRYDLFFYRWGTCDLFRGLKIRKLAGDKLRDFKATDKLTLMLLDAKLQTQRF